MTSPEGSNLYASARAARDEAIRMEQVARSKIEGAGEIMRQLQQRILQGEPVTGDRLLDFIIAKHGFNAELELPKYKDVQEKLKGKKGEMVLRVEREAIAATTHRPFPSVEEPGISDYRIVERYGVGILTGESLLFDSTTNANPPEHRFGQQYAGTCEFPTQGFKLAFSNNSSIKDVKTALPAELIGIDAPLLANRFDPQALLHPHGLEIAVGNEEVAKWFHGNNKKEVFDRISGSINRKLL